MNMKPMLEISHYSKAYGTGKKAVDDVSLVVMPGFAASATALFALRTSS